MEKHLYSITHIHEYGADTKIVRADHLPTEDEVVERLGLDFEPERGEEIDINAITDNTIQEL